MHRGATNGSASIISSVACFLRGTPDPDEPRAKLPVEILSIGDEILTHDGRKRADQVDRTAELSRQILRPGSSKVVPVVIRAGALADNVPVRDLRRVARNMRSFSMACWFPRSTWSTVRTIVRELTADVVEYFHIEVEGQAHRLCRRRAG